MRNPNAIRQYYILPCCLLLLNLCIALVSYKARMIDDALLRTAAIMGMVLVGGSIVGFVLAPAIGVLIGWLHHHSRARWGEIGEIFFLLALGLFVFWLYYRVYILGPESVLPAEWRNPRVYH